MTDQLGGWSATRPTTTTTVAWTCSSLEGHGFRIADSTQLAPQQRRWQVHRRDQGGRACSSRSTPTAACWADYDNDGWLDVFVGCEQQPNLLYHNRGDGTFEEVSAKAGLRDIGRVSVLQGNHVGRL